MIVVFDDYDKYVFEYRANIWTMRHFKIKMGDWESEGFYIKINLNDPFKRISDTKVQYE